MKTKNLILALAGIFFAVGSAFAFKYLSTTAFIKVRYSFNPPFVFTCVNTGISCNDMGSINCKIIVTDIGAVALARSNASCPAPSLFHSLAQGDAGEYNDSQTIIEVINN